MKAVSLQPVISASGAGSRPALFPWWHSLQGLLKKDHRLKPVPPGALGLAEQGWHRLQPVLIRLALAATLFSVLWTFTPPAEPHLRLCGFYWLTGHPCALCGLTRALFALAKGHFAEAERFNALAPLGFAMIFSLFWNNRFTGRIWPAGIAAFALYGVCRIL